MHSPFLVLLTFPILLTALPSPLVPPSLAVGSITIQPRNVTVVNNASLASAISKIDFANKAPKFKQKTGALVKPPVRIRSTEEPPKFKDHAGALVANAKPPRRARSADYYPSKVSSYKNHAAVLVGNAAPPVSARSTEGNGGVAHRSPDITVLEAQDAVPLSHRRRDPDQTPSVDGQDNMSPGLLQTFNFHPKELRDSHAVLRQLELRTPRIAESESLEHQKREGSSEEGDVTSPTVAVEAASTASFRPAIYPENTPENTNVRLYLNFKDKVPANALVPPPRNRKREGSSEENDVTITTTSTVNFMTTTEPFITPTTPQESSTDGYLNFANKVPMSALVPPPRYRKREGNGEENGMIPTITAASETASWTPYLNFANKVPASALVPPPRYRKRDDMIPTTTATPELPTPTAYLPLANKVPMSALVPPPRYHKRDVIREENAIPPNTTAPSPSPSKPPTATYLPLANKVPMSALVPPPRLHRDKRGNKVPATALVPPNRRAVYLHPIAPTATQQSTQSPEGTANYDAGLPLATPKATPLYRARAADSDNNAPGAPPATQSHPPLQLYRKREADNNQNPHPDTIPLAPAYPEPVQETIQPYSSSSYSSPISSPTSSPVSQPVRRANKVPANALVPPPEERRRAVESGDGNDEGKGDVADSSGAMKLGSGPVAGGSDDNNGDLTPEYKDGTASGGSTSYEAFWAPQEYPTPCIGKGADRACWFASEVKVAKDELVPPKKEGD